MTINLGQAAQKIGVGEDESLTIKFMWPKPFFF